MVWNQPGAELDVLIAGGEGQAVEFKQEVPMRDEQTKRKVVKSICYTPAILGAWKLDR